MCLRAPVDAPKLEWIAPAFPKPSGPFGPAFLITTAKWPRLDDSFIPISGEELGFTIVTSKGSYGLRIYFTV